MFSGRVPALRANRVAGELARLRSEGRPLDDLTASNPTRVELPYPPDLLAPLASPDALVHDPAPFGLPAAREAVAAHLAGRGVAVHPDRVVLTASTSEAYGLLFKLLCDPGDAVLVPQPSYPLFEHLTRLDGVAARPYRLEYHGRWQVDVDGLAAMVDARTRAVLLVSPNNPTGSFVRPDELAAIRAVAVRHGLAIVCDEVFEGYQMEEVAGRSGALVADGTPAGRSGSLVADGTPVGRSAAVVADGTPAGRSAAVVADGTPTGRSGSLVADAGALTFTLGGLSKSAGLPQLKLGWILVGGPDRLVAPARDRLELVCDTYLSVATPVQLAAGVLLERSRPVADAILRRVRANYAALRRLADRYPACRVLRTEGGWYAVVQVPAIRSEEALVVELLRHDGVHVHPGYFFDFPREAFLVLSLLPPPDAFAGAATRVLARASRSPR